VVFGKVTLFQEGLLHPNAEGNKGATRKEKFFFYINVKHGYFKHFTPCMRMQNTIAAK